MKPLTYETIEQAFEKDVRPYLIEWFIDDGTQGFLQSITEGGVVLLGIVNERGVQSLKCPDAHRILIAFGLKLFQEKRLKIGSDLRFTVITDVIITNVTNGIQCMVLDFQWCLITGS